MWALLILRRRNSALKKGTSTIYTAVMKLALPIEAVWSPTCWNTPAIYKTKPAIRVYFPASPRKGSRNLAEIKRILQSLQLHDTENVSTPVDWQPGANAVYGAPLTLEEADARMNEPAEDMIPLDWYLTLKKM